MPVIPFLSLSSGGRARRREGQKGRLGEPRVAEDTKRRSGAPPGGSGGWMETEAPEAELEDEAAGRQHTVEGVQPSYSELTAFAASLFPFRSLATPAAREDQAPARGACRAGEKTPVVVATSKGDDGVWGAAGR